MRRVAAFSLIELLVVIAIIAILAAIIFPVYSKTKDAAFRSDDMASMNQLRTALELYYTDQGGYPPALLGYATLYTSGPLIGQVVPATAIHSYLFPERVGALTTFQPAYNKFAPDLTTTAVYPNADPRPLGTAPIGDLNGDGTEDNNDDLDAMARQAFGPGDGNVCLGGGVGCLPASEAQFYKLSGYDVSEVPVPIALGGGRRTELKYTLFWTQYGLGPGSGFDDPRQLGYANPPDDTVITWNTYFREMDSNQDPRPINRDIVLFVGGSAKAFDSKAISDRSWRVVVSP